MRGPQQGGAILAPTQQQFVPLRSDPPAGLETQRGQQETRTQNRNMTAPPQTQSMRQRTSEPRGRAGQPVGAPTQSSTQQQLPGARISSSLNTQPMPQRQQRLTPNTRRSQEGLPPNTERSYITPTQRNAPTQNTPAIQQQRRTYAPAPTAQQSRRAAPAPVMQQARPTSPPPARRPAKKNCGGAGQPKCT
jgi:hypothetical protein